MNSEVHTSSYNSEHQSRDSQRWDTIKVSLAKKVEGLLIPIRIYHILC